MMRHLALAAVIAAGATGTAMAQAPDTSEGRFQLERQGEGFVRLDRQSGLTSYCVERDGRLSCRAGEDERAALQEEIDRLAARVDELEGRPAAERGEKDDRSITLRLPSEQEVNQVLGFFEDMARRFVDMVRGIGGSSEGQRI